MNCRNSDCKEVFFNRNKRIGIASGVEVIWFCSIDCVKSSSEYKALFADNKSFHWDEMSRILKIEGEVHNVPGGYDN